MAMTTLAITANGQSDDEIADKGRLTQYENKRAGSGTSE
jgi:hypothetical protein